MKKHIWFSSLIFSAVLAAALLASCGGGGGGGTSGGGAAPATYSVTYNGNGNTAGTVPVDSTKYKQGDTVTVLDNTGSLVKTGYKFTGWNTQTDGHGTSYVAADTFTMSSANMTLYAIWTGGTVTGTVTLPASVTEKCYIVWVSTSQTALPAAAATSGQVTGSSFDYTMNAPSGIYYVFAVVDNDGSNASPPTCSFTDLTLTNGDFFGGTTTTIPVSIGETSNSSITLFTY